MATKKVASKKTADTTGTPAKAAAKKAPATKAAAKTAAKTAAEKADETTTAQPAAAKAKAKPSHHDVSVQAYLLWERDGKKHGHHDHYWHEAERELHK